MRHLAVIISSHCVHVRMYCVRMYFVRLCVCGCICVYVDVCMCLCLCMCMCAYLIVIVCMAMAHANMLMAHANMTMLHANTTMTPRSLYGKIDHFVRFTCRNARTTKEFAIITWFPTPEYPDNDPLLVQVDMRRPAAVAPTAMFLDALCPCQIMYELSPPFMFMMRMHGLDRAPELVPVRTHYPDM